MSGPLPPTDIGRWSVRRPWRAIGLLLAFVVLTVALFGMTTGAPAVHAPIDSVTAGRHRWLPSHITTSGSAESHREPVGGPTAGAFSIDSRRAAVAIASDRPTTATLEDYSSDSISNDLARADGLWVAVALVVLLIAFGALAVAVV
jgi:hypothetical protein